MRQFPYITLLLAAHACAADPFHFAIVSDRTGRAVPGVYPQVWREVAAAHPDFVVTLGDAIEGLSTQAPGPEDSARAEWRSVRKDWLTNVPIYHTPGNHDIWDAASEALFTRETGRKPFYSFDSGGAHFVILDNSRTENLAPEQLRFLETDLQAAHPSGPRFIFFHRPFWLIPLKLGASGFALQKLAKQYGVCCIISGHGHQLQSAKQDGVLYLEVGSSGASLAGAGPSGLGYADGWFYQYAWVTVSPLSSGAHTVDFEIRELGPPFGQSRRQSFHTETR